VDAAGASASAQREADWQWWLIGIAFLVIGVIGGALLKSDAGGPAFELKAGISVFALLIVAAQAIERLAEVTSRVPGIGMRFGPNKSKSKTDARQMRNAALVAGINASNDAVGQSVKLAAAQKVAEGEQDLAVINANRASFFIGFNAALAGLAAGYFNVSLLELLGSSNVPNWLDILVTSLAISGGTKPLHDLISKIETNKQNSEASSEVRAV
jgi:uncharacterized membrane protein YfcA